MAGPNSTFPQISSFLLWAPTLASKTPRSLLLQLLIFNLSHSVFSSVLLSNVRPQHFKNHLPSGLLIPFSLRKFHPPKILIPWAKDFQIHFHRELQTCISIYLLGHLYLDGHLQCNTSNSGLIKPAPPQTISNLENCAIVPENRLITEA